MKKLLNELDFPLAVIIAFFFAAFLWLLLLADNADFLTR